MIAVYLKLHVEESALYVVQNALVMHSYCDSLSLRWAE